MDQDLHSAAPTSTRLLEGAPNFRDLGGLKGVDGRSVRAGMVYRSGALDELRVADLALLETLGVSLCCDLRTGAERTLSPSRWPEGRVPRLLELEFSSDVRALSPELMQLLSAAPSPDNAMRMMLGLYRSMPATCAPLLARLFPELADAADAFPVVIHCTAGKDRTGFVVAVLLTILGVAPADIRADYLYSNHSSAHLRRNAKVQALLQQLLGMTPDPHAVDALTKAAPEYLDAALSEVRQGFGSVQRYLCEAAGIDEAMQARLRQRLLETAATSA